MGTAIALGIVDNVAVHSDFQTTVQYVITTENNVVTLLGNIETTLVNLNNTYPVSVDIEPYVSLSQTMLNLTQQQSTQVNQYEGYREDVVIGLYAVMALVAVLAILTALASSRVLAVFVTIIGLLILPFALVLIGINLPAATFVADGCPEMEDYVLNQTSATEQGWIEFYLDCTGQPPLQNETEYLTDQLYYAQAALFKAKLQNDTKEIAEYTLVVAYVEQILSNLSVLANCTIVQPAFSLIKDEICDKILDGLFLIVVTCLVIAVLIPCVVHNALNVFTSERKDPQGDYSRLSEKESVGQDRFAIEEGGQSVKYNSLPAQDDSDNGSMKVVRRWG